MIFDLKTLIKIPSVSAKNQSLVECAEAVSTLMNRVGINSEIIYLDPKDKDITSPVPPPIVYGEIKSQKNPKSKTILFYNHYDVQPEDPIELWDHSPFSGKVEGNYIYGRGAADDKGELIARIKAVQYLLQVYDGDLPCNIKFIVEGEEEIGSPHLQKYLEHYKDKLKADVVIWEDGFVDSNEKAIVSLGQKGLFCVEINVKGPSKDIHSSNAVLIENPALILSKIVCSLINGKTGKILIKDWYKEIKEFTPEEKEAIAKETFDEEVFKREVGVKRFINNLTGYDAKLAHIGLPTCNVSGLSSGYTGPGSKTIIPSKASAKIDFRLVPDMDYLLQFERLQNHVKEMGFDIGDDNSQIELNLLIGENGYRTPLDNVFVKPVLEAAKEAFGDSIVSVSAAGTGPMYYFYKIFNVSSICIGGSDISNKAHSPNECFRIDRLGKITKCIAKIIEIIFIA